MNKIIIFLYSSPCKVENFIGMAESLTKSNEALFLCHVSSWWLTLSPSFEVVLKPSKNRHKYFPEHLHLPLQKEYKYHLPKNLQYHRIKKCMGENAKVCIYLLVKWDSFTLIPGMPYLPLIMKIESRIVKQCFKLYIKKWFCKKLLRISHTFCLNIICQDSF